MENFQLKNQEFPLFKKNQKNLQLGWVVKAEKVNCLKNIIVLEITLGWVENAPSERYQKSTSEYM